MAADLHALAAARAVVGLDRRAQAAVLLHLAPARGAAHADVLDGPAEAGQFVALEMADRDQHVGVHDVAAQVGRVEMSARAGHGPFVAAFEPVGDDDGRAEDVGVEAVGRGLQAVGYGFTPLADVKGVGVRQKGFCPALADEGQ